VVLLLGAAVSVAVFAVRTAFSADPLTVDVAVGPQISMLLILGAVGAVAGFYWLISRWTFGGEFVDDAVDSGTEAVEQAKEAVDD
jgi:hypothetical protein